MARRGLILALLLAAPAAAQIKEKRRELNNVQKELEKTLEELESLKAEEKGLGRDVSRLENLDGASRRRSDALQTDIRRAEARRAELKSRLDSAGRVGSFWSAAMAVELAQHRSAIAAEPDARGTRGLWADEFRRVAVLEKSRHLRGLLGFRKQAEKDAAETSRRALTLSESRRRVQAERAGHRREYEAKKAALEQTQERVASAARKAKELEESAKALTSLLDRLGKAASFRRPGTPARLDLPRHSLPWPVAGKVLRGFGRERDPELGTWTVRQGLEIASSPAAVVSAVAAGKVIFAGPFRSYGQVLILDHGAGFFSVYGELGEILKGKGSPARAGEPIARVGAAKDGEGRLYLELRRGTEALDPQAWLEKKPDGGS